MARKINFPGLLDEGENPHGFRAVEPNGTGKGGIGGDFERQMNWGPGLDGPRWNPTPEQTLFVVGTVTTKRSRRR